MAEPKLTIRQRVEAYCYGTIRNREGDFESIAAEVLGMTQEEVDAEIAKEVVIA